MIAGQYGIVDDTELGRWLTIPGFEQFIHKVLRGIVHLAEAPPGLRPHVAARTAGCLWLPIADADPSLDQFLRSKLQLWARSRVHDWLKVSDTLPILSGVHPLWWEALPLAHWQDIAHLFQNCPVGGAAWLVWVNLVPPAFCHHAEVPLVPGGVGNYVAADLDFGHHFRDRFTNFIEQWARYVPVIRLFFTTDSASCTKKGSWHKLQRDQSSMALSSAICLM